MKKIIITIVILLLPLLASSVQGAVYYLDCELGNNNNDGLSPQTAWKSFNLPNLNMVAGDTLYVRGGTDEASIAAKAGYVQDSNLANIHWEHATYGSTSAQGVSPENSGAVVDGVARYITYTSYPGETARITGAYGFHSKAIEITGRSYIRVTGLDFYYLYQFMIIDGGDYNEVDHCTFDQVRYMNDDNISVDWRGSTIYHNATHNWVHDNTFSNYGAYSYTNDLGVLFEVGIDAATATIDNSDYNTIENNHMYHGGHHVLGVNSGGYNVARNNKVHNEAWYASAECGALYRDN